MKIFKIALADRLTLPNKTELVTVSGNIEGEGSFNLLPNDQLWVTDPSGAKKGFLRFIQVLNVRHFTPPNDPIKFHLSIGYNGNEKELIGCTLTKMEK